MSQSGRISTRMLLCQLEALKRDLARGGVLSAHVVYTPQTVEHRSSFADRRFVIEKISGSRKNPQSFSRRVTFTGTHHLGKRQMEVQLSPVSRIISRQRPNEFDGAC